MALYPFKGVHLHAVSFIAADLYKEQNPSVFYQKSYNKARLRKQEQFARNGCQILSNIECVCQFFLQRQKDSLYLVQYYILSLIFIIHNTNFNSRQSFLVLEIFIYVKHIYYISPFRRVCNTPSLYQIKFYFILYPMISYGTCKSLTLKTLY